MKGDHLVFEKTRQACTNLRHQEPQATKFCTTTPNICYSSIWNLHHVTHLVPRIFRWFPNFWKISASLKYGIANKKKKHIHNLYINNKFFTKNERQNNTITAKYTKTNKTMPRKEGLMGCKIRNPYSLTSLNFCTSYGEVTIDVLHYLCDLLVCGSLIFHCRL